MTDRPLALITGASGGIGLDLARCAAADGYDVVLTARRKDALEAAAGEIASRYRVSASVIAEDLTDPEAPARIVAGIDRPIDVLVNNAGFGIWKSFVESDATDIDDMVRVNVAALTTLTRLVLPGMIERGRGGVLNVASVAGFMSGPHAATYYATKNYVLVKPKETRVCYDCKHAEVSPCKVVFQRSNRGAEILLRCALCNNSFSRLEKRHKRPLFEAQNTLRSPVGPKGGSGFKGLVSPLCRRLPTQ